MARIYILRKAPIMDGKQDLKKEVAKVAYKSDQEVGSVRLNNATSKPLAITKCRSAQRVLRDRYLDSSDSRRYFLCISAKHGI